MKFHKIYLCLFVVILLVSCRPKYQRELAKQLAEYEYSGGVASTEEMKELERKVAFYGEAVNYKIYADLNEIHYIELLAILYFQNGLYKKAIENFQISLNEFPTSGKMHAHIAEAYKLLGINTIDEYEKNKLLVKSEKHYLLAIQNRPEASEYYKDLVVLYMGYMNKYAEALPLTDLWANFTEQKDEADFAKAQALSALGRLQEAESLYAQLAKSAKSKIDREAAEENRTALLNSVN